MLSTMNRLPIVAGLLISGLAFGLPFGLASGQTPATEPDAPPPPPLPPKKVPSDQIVPTVTIRTDEKGALVEEYRINGALYMMRVTPKKGVPYYLLDMDGDGNLETSQIPGDTGPQPVYWKLFEWQ